MAEIHPTAIVDSKADLDADVRIGPFCVVEEDVVLGAGTSLGPGVHICRWTRLGKNNVVHQGSILGGPPQDRKYSGERSFLEIGDDNVFREFVSLHRGSGEDTKTTIGDDNYLMAYCHVGHNCAIGNQVTMANGVGVSGHVSIEDMANIGGLTGIHQFVRIGKVTMIGGMSRIVKDVPPFMLMEGNPAEVRDINAVGLRRIGVTKEARMALHKACKLLFRSSMGMTHAVQTVKREVQMCDEVEYLLKFVAGTLKGRFGRQEQA